MLAVNYVIAVLEGAIAAFNEWRGVGEGEAEGRKENFIRLLEVVCIVYSSLLSYLKKVIRFGMEHI